MITIQESICGVHSSGREVKSYIMRNSAGMTAEVISYGCIITRLLVPGRDGAPVDVVLGYDSLADYIKGTCFFGSLVGRYANRIKGAAFPLGGRTYTLSKNDGNNHLHGVFGEKIWDSQIDGDSVVFTLTSPDMEEGYPGTLRTEVRYALTDDCSLKLSYKAVTDAPTVINLTNHSYFNLNGHNSGSILNHSLMINADQFTEGNDETIPTGRILPVKDTPMDFRTAKKIGTDIHSDFAQIRLCSGYDHNYVLNAPDSGLRMAACAVGDLTGIRMETYTTQPGMQLYTGNFVTGDAVKVGKGGAVYPQYAAFCLETQHFPCSPNFPEFPSTQLNPGETYNETTIYHFSQEG